MNDAQLVSPGPDGSEAPDRPKILVVEDDPDIRKILEIFLTEKRFQVKVTDGADTALTTLDQEPVDVILSDVRMPGMSGLELLRHLKDRDPDIQLVLMSAYSSVKDAVEAIQLGAADYVEKPIDFRRLERVLQTVLEKRHLEHRTRILEQRLQGCVTFEGIVARSQRMLEVFAFVERLARYPTTALVTGESGTGKELVARALHRLSPLRDRPFVVCNCTTLAPTLLESELFGHVRGAFTGADRDRRGLFEEAGDGTVFLDEVGEAPPSVQAKLLRVLQHEEVKAVGADRVRHVRARIVAATNRPLEAEARAGRFRLDLYYRLAVLPLRVPPLRHRSAEIPGLIGHFLGRFEAREGRETGGFDGDALRVLQAYPWPGNVRELENEIHRLVLCLAQGQRIRRQHLARRIREADPAAHDEPLSRLLERVEIALIRQRLQEKPTKTAAARSLGITREALYAKMRRLGMTTREARPVRGVRSA